MTTPTTELDARFSEPGAVATSWEETRRALESAELFWICTVGRDGRPGGHGGLEAGVLRVDS